MEQVWSFHNRGLGGGLAHGIVILQLHQSCASDRRIETVRTRVTLKSSTGSSGMGAGGARLGRAWLQPLLSE
jgi:hypothetical protein